MLIYMKSELLTPAKPLQVSGNILLCGIESPHSYSNTEDILLLVIPYSGLFSKQNVCITHAKLILKVFFCILSLASITQLCT